MHELSYGPVGTQARAILMRKVFGAAPEDHGAAPEWMSAGFSTASGLCVACTDVAILSVLLDGAVTPMGALRLVAVHPDWRGRGLFRAMMVHALAWCDARTPGLTLLYAEQPELYGRFGFNPVAQHAFVGPAPRAEGRGASRTLSWPADRSIIARCLAGRCAVSLQCSMVGAPALFLQALEADPSIALAYLEEHDTLIAYETDGATILLVDVVAPALPSLASILGALDQRFETVRALFPPDRLAWLGHPVTDDTGLMLRGALPTAMSRPFMLPPTTGF